MTDGEPVLVRDRICEGFAFAAGLGSDCLATKVLVRLDVRRCSWPRPSARPTRSTGRRSRRSALRASVMDIPAMTPSTWLEDSACSAALKPRDLISTWNPWFLAISRMMSMSMPVSSPPASRNSNGAKVVSVPMTKVFPDRLDGAAPAWAAEAGGAACGCRGGAGGSEEHCGKRQQCSEHRGGPRPGGPGLLDSGQE